MRRSGAVVRFASRRWYRKTTFVGVWSVSLLIAVPGTGSSVADATLSSATQSALVLASVNNAPRVMAHVPESAAPMVRMVRLDQSQLRSDLGVPQGAPMVLEDGFSDLAGRPELPHEVDLSRLQTAWLAQFAPQATLRPTLRPVPPARSLSTSGVIAAPAALSPEVTAPRVSLVPVARPEGLSRRMVQYSRSWLRKVALRPLTEQEACLATAIYHEARGETLKGQFAVAEVILNRVASRRFPADICGVVFQGVREGRYGGCQFSFACDSKPDEMRNGSASDLARRIAQVMSDGAHRGLTGGALYFHTTAVAPSWSKRMTQTTQIGAHLFFRG
ncbi:MAG: Cell wall hydrolyses involved in spore germination [Roseibaca calidilacus]|uniref:Cell wall hydrolase CwlJ, involved in spore germination n=1 Tax=Roseibaca calidilacus TaxID=1666912 RepID=A0A0P7W269_9RHOB|nr:cell wall hydrolase [Roseibaca calidilacus]KPP90030.1 MAG: Cell wall hydrolyses involved in spore germination [Roseibaca calidilacus]CUX81135.1 Cell wall hydrolase CwlJ, involved in spore germination [Roseibaca calidilacus]